MQFNIGAGRPTVCALAACAALLIAACAPKVVPGRLAEDINNATHVGDLLAADGPSGIKPGAPAPTGTVAGTDNGDTDHLALLAVNDIADFWQQNFSGAQFAGQFTALSNLASYDSRDPNSPPLCGAPTAGLVNAFFCPPKNLMAWDRGELVPTGREFFGDISVSGLIGHEYGHAIQHMAELVNADTPVIVLEQQADCFGGAYLHYVAAGDSKRFRVSTGDGLNHVLAGLITLRDPTLGPDDTFMLHEGHGTALDRVSAFQLGFTAGPRACAAIDLDDIEHRREGIPMELADDPDDDHPRRGIDVPLDRATFSLLAETLTTLLHPQHPPAISFDAPSCPDGQTHSPASYCPSSNTLALDVAALQKMGKPADEDQERLLQGDNTAISIVTSRYMLAMERERGTPLSGGAAALRTACLTAAAQRDMAKPVDVPSGQHLTLAAGDLDKAVAGLLTNGMVATDVNGAGVVAGFTRIAAFRTGLIGGQDICYRRYF